MQINKNDSEKPGKSTYREVKVGKTTYCVTSVFSGEKHLGAALERLAVQKVIGEMDRNAQQVLHGQHI